MDFGLGSGLSKPEFIKSKPDPNLIKIQKTKSKPDTTNFGSSPSLPKPEFQKFYK